MLDAPTRLGDHPLARRRGLALALGLTLALPGTSLAAQTSLVKDINPARDSFPTELIQKAARCSSPQTTERMASSCGAATAPVRAHGWCRTSTRLETLTPPTSPKPVAPCPSEPTTERMASSCDAATAPRRARCS
jgi:hypothetical protein